MVPSGRSLAAGGVPAECTSVGLVADRTGRRDTYPDLAMVRQAQLRGSAAVRGTPPGFAALGAHDLAITQPAQAVPASAAQAALLPQPGPVRAASEPRRGNGEQKHRYPVRKPHRATADDRGGRRGRPPPAVRGPGPELQRDRRGAGRSKIEAIPPEPAAPGAERADRARAGRPARPHDAEAPIETRRDAEDQHRGHRHAHRQEKSSSQGSPGGSCGLRGGPWYRHR